MLEPLDDVIDALIKKYGPISPVAEYLAKSKGMWLGVPTAVGSQVKPCCSRFDLYKEHAGLDLRDMFPADESKYDKAKTDKWTWDALCRRRRRSCTRPASRSACRWARPPTRSTGSAACSTPMASVFVDAKDNIKINSDQTRQAMEIARKIMEVSPPEVLRLGRRRQQSLADLRQGLGHHESAERLGGRQARQSEGGGEVLDACRAEGAEGPLRRTAAAVLRPVEVLQEQAGGERSPPYISQKESIAQLVEASIGYDLPSFKTMYDLDTWKTVEPPVGTVYSYPPRGDEQTSMSGAPARSEVGAQMYNQAINTVMISKFTQGKEKLDDVIKWAEKELEGTLRA